MESPAACGLGDPPEIPGVFWVLHHPGFPLITGTITIKRGLMEGSLCEQEHQDRDLARRTPGIRCLSLRKIYRPRLMAGITATEGAVP